MKILITGAAGFMGSHLFDYLLNQGYDVYGIDNYSLGIYKHERIYNLDLVDKEKTSEFITKIKPNIVFHLAAWAHEGLSQFMPIKINDNNYTAYLNLLIPCIKNKVKRIVVCSSMSVYGSQEPPFTEEMDLKPEDIYAVSKKSMEEATKILAKVYSDLEYVILRPHNVIGPRQCLHDPYRNVAAIFINKMLEGKPFYIYGDGEQKRSFSYIDDVTPYVAEAGFKDISGEVINIGPIEEFTVNYLARVIMENFPENKHLSPIYLPDRPLEVKNAWSSNERAISVLGYKTNTKFEDGVKKMCEWAKSIGYQKPVYLDSLELENDSTPITWRDKLI
jgi:UDP-glucose 4-epimerase